MARIDELFFDVSYRVDLSQARRAQQETKKVQQAIAGGTEEAEQFAATAGASFRQLARDAKRTGEKVGDELSSGIDRVNRELRDVDFGEIDIGAKERRLERQAQRAGEAAGSGFGRAFSARARREGREAGEAVLEALQQQFRTKVSDAREALFRGLIDEQEFNRRGTRAAEQFNDGVLRTIRRLAERGALDEQTQARLTDSLKDAGRRGGTGFADAADDSIRGRLRRLPRFIRGTLAAGVAAAFAFAMRGAIRVVRAAAERIQQLLETAGEVQQLRQGFETLTLAADLDPTETLQRLRRAVRGTVDDLELMRVTNEALQGGLELTAADLEELVGVSRRVGRSLGIDATESYRRFVQGIVRGRRQILDDLGIIVDWGAAYERAARELGKTAEELTEQEKVQARANEALRAGRDVVDELGEETLTAGERVAQLSTFLTNVGRATAEAFATTPRVREFLDSFGRSAEELADSMDRLAASIGAVIDTALSLASVTDVLELALSAATGSAQGVAAATAELGGRFAENQVRRLHELELRRISTRTDLVDLAVEETLINEQIDRLLRQQARSGERNQRVIEQIRRLEERLLGVRERQNELLRDRGDIDGTDVGLSEEEIEARLEAVEDLIGRLETLREFDLSGLFGRLPAQAEEIIGRIEALDARIERVRAALETGDAPEGLRVALESLEAQSAEAREELRRTVAQMDVLREFGAVELFEDLPAEAAAALERVVQLGEAETELELTVAEDPLERSVRERLADVRSRIDDLEAEAVQLEVSVDEGEATAEQVERLNELWREIEELGDQEVRLRLALEEGDAEEVVRERLQQIRAQIAELEEREIQLALNIEGGEGGEAVRAELAGVREEIDRLESERIRLELAIDDSEARTALRERLDAIEGRIRALSDEEIRLQIAVEEGTAEEAAERELDRVREQIEELQEEEVRLQIDVEEGDETARDRLDEVRRQVAALEEQEIQLRVAIEEGEAVDAVRERLAGVRSELGALEDQRLELELAVDDAAVEAARERLGAVQAELEGLAAEEVELRVQIEEGEGGAEVRGRLEEIQARVAELEETRGELELRIESGDVEAARDRLRELEAGIEQLEQERVQLQLQVDAGEVTPEIRARLEEIRGELGALEATRIDLQIGVDADADAARERLRTVQSQIEELERERIELQLSVDAGEASQQVRDRLAEVRDQLEALEARETRLRLTVDEAGAESARQRLEDLRSEAERARDRVRDVVIEMDLLSELEIPDLFGELPDRAQEIVDRIVELRGREIELQLRIEEGDAPTDAREQLARIRAEADEARQALEQMRAEGLFLPGVGDAIDQVEELTRQLGLLRDFDFEGALGDAPPELLATLETVGQLQREIEELDRILDIEGLPPDVAERAEELRGELVAQRDEAESTAQAWSELSDVVDAFGQLGRDLFEGMTPDEIEVVSEAVRRLSDDIRLVVEAGAEVELAREALERAEEGTEAYAEAQERLQRATSELDDAQSDLNRELDRVEQLLQNAGFSAAEIADIMDRLRGSTEGAGEGASELQETLSTFAGIARGVLRVADAMDVLDDSTRKVLEGVQAVAEGIGRIAAGDVLGGIVEGVGGVVSIASGLFGEDPGVKRLRQTLEDNRRAIEDLTTAIDRQLRFFQGFTGRQIQALEQFTATALSQFGITELDASPFRLAELDLLGTPIDQITAEDIEQLGGEFEFEGFDFEAFQRELRAAGLTLEDLEDAARDLGLTFDRDNIVESFIQLRDALRELELEQALGTFTGQMDLLQREIELFDIDSPVEQLRRLRSIFLEFIDLPAELEAEIQGADLTTAEGRAELEALIQQIFRQIQAGEFDPTQFGGLTLQQTLELLGQLESSIDNLAEAEGEGAGAESFQIFRGISELRASRIEGVLTSIDLVSRKQLAELISIREVLGGETPEDLPFLEPLRTGGNGLQPPDERLFRTPERRTEPPQITGPLLSIERVVVEDTSPQSAEAFAEDTVRAIEERLGDRERRFQEALGRMQTVE